MKTLIIALSILLLPIVSTATVYRCNVDGKVIFTDIPCAGSQNSVSTSLSSFTKGSEGRLGSVWKRSFRKAYDEFDKKTTAFIMPSKEIIVHTRWKETAWGTPIITYNDSNDVLLFGLNISLESDTWMFIDDTPMRLLLDNSEEITLTNRHTSRDTGRSINNNAVVKEETIYELDSETFSKILAANSVMIRINGEKRNITSEISKETIFLWQRFYDEFFK